MSKGKKGPRRAGPLRPDPAPVDAPAAGTRSGGVAPVSPGATSSEAEEPQGIYPPFGVSLARGMQVAAASPLLLLTCFLGTLVLWAAFTVYGVVLAASPAAMVLLQALPPVHSFLDLSLLNFPLISGRGGSLLAALVLAVAILAARAVMLSTWIALMIESFEGRRGKAALPGVGRRAVSGLRALLGLEAGFLALALVGLFLLAGLLGQLGVMAALVGGTYFMVMAPVIAVREGLGVRASAELAVRAARLPGRRHLVLALSYLLLALFVPILTPSSRVAEATPSVAVWAYVLFVGFLHMAVLGALVYRWLMVRRALVGDEDRQEVPADG